MCRVFARGKTTNSLNRKLQKDPGKYAVGRKLVQDAAGLRVVLYFPEDIAIVEELLKAKFLFDAESSTIDVPSPNQFSVSRHNLIFAIPEAFRRDLDLGKGSAPVDNTFEVQIRTLFSEGWHEIEHDLRYKRPKHWEAHVDLNRSFNGVVAALETSEWGIKTILDELAYRHYKNGNWEAMLSSALRMRVEAQLSKELGLVLSSDPLLAKAVFRVSRRKMFRALAAMAPKIPLTLDNLVCLWNYLELNDPRLNALTPEFLHDTFKSSLEKQSERVA